MEKLISYFLFINAEQFEKQLNRSLNYFKIAFYFTQLAGYTFSQLEAKVLIYQEANYLATIIQTSSVSFLLYIFADDQLTKFVYFSMVGVLFGLTIFIIFQTYNGNNSSKNILNQIVIAFLSNLQWYFLTPFQETFIAVITCGYDAYLLENAEIPKEDCYSSLPIYYLIFSFVGTILITVLGILSLYCFRNADFLQKQLLRKYKFVNLASLILHQLLIILCYQKQNIGSDIPMHFCYFLLVLINIYDSATNITFGISYESTFYLQCGVMSLIFDIVVLMWTYGSSDDKFILFTLLLTLSPVMAYLKSHMNNYYDEILSQFAKKVHRVDICLEYLYGIGILQKKYENNDRLIFIKYMQLHCDSCKLIHCPCRQNIHIFFNFSQQINQKILLRWIQFQFAIAQDNQKTQEFEQNSIKSLTFLLNYQQNAILSYRFAQNLLYSTKKHRNLSLYFRILLQVFQSFNINQIKIECAKQTTISVHEYLILQDVSYTNQFQSILYPSLSQLIKLNLNLWNSYANHQIKDFEHLLQLTANIQAQIKQIYFQLNKYTNQRNEKIQTTYSLRIQLLVNVLCCDDLDHIHSQAQQIMIFDSIKDQQFKNTEFHNHSFLNGSGIGIISNISIDKLGLINQKVDKNFLQYFGYLDADIILTKVEQLMPKNLAFIHTNLIENYFRRGYSKRINSVSMTFILNGMNHIEKTKLILSNLYPGIHGQDFYMIAYLNKLRQVDPFDMDFSKTGYIMTDMNGLIYGLSKNIFERINYQFFYQNNKDAQILMTEEIYGKIKVSTFLPQFKYAFIINYNSQIVNQFLERIAMKQRNDQEIICQKQKGLFQLPKHISINKKFISEKSIKNIKIPYKNVRSELKIGILKDFQIEYSITRSTLHPLDEETQIKQDFVFYEIEIEFQDENILAAQQKNNCNKTPTLSELIKHQQSQNVQIDTAHGNGSIRLLSDQNEFVQEKIELVLGDQSIDTSKNSSRSISFQVKMLHNQLNSEKYPKQFLRMIVQFIIHLIMLVTTMLFIIIIFYKKKSIQSDCITHVNLDINFLDAYSEVFLGSRHLIFYRDFYEILEDGYLDQGNSQTLKISRYDNIVFSYQHIINGLKRLKSQHQTYLKSVLEEADEETRVYLINYELNEVKSDVLFHKGAYYSVMYEIFYWSLVSFGKDPSIYLKRINDAFIVQFTRSMTYFNFFNVTNIIQKKIEQCKNYNLDSNDSIDQIALTVFLIFFFCYAIILLIQLFTYAKLIKHIKIYLKYFKLCTIEDSLQAIQYYELLDKLLNQEQFLFSNEFKIITNFPAHTIETINKQQQIMVQSDQSRLVKRVENRKQLSTHISFKQITFIICLCSLICLIYNLSFQLYYNEISNNIAPITDKALKAQEYRFNYILSIHRWDLFLITKYYNCYNYCYDNCNMTDSKYNYTLKNIQTDNKILTLNYINFQDIINNQNYLESQRFVDLIYHDSSIKNLPLSEQQNEDLLTGDVCQITNCDMNLLVTERPYADYLIGFFERGIIDLMQQISQIYKNNLQLINQDCNKQSDFIKIEELLLTQEFFMYVTWGLDLVQFQIAEFCQYFVNLSFSKLELNTQSSQDYIIIFGIITTSILLGSQLYIINKLFQKYKTAKQTLKLIPLQVLFMNNIPYHLKLMERKNNN